MAGDVKNFPGGKPIVILGTDGTDLYGITVDTAGHVQVDVLSNALPTGAATETTLASVLAKLDVALSTRALEAGGNLAAASTALQLIDDFALGTNKLFGYNNRYSETGSDLNAAGGNVAKYGATVPAGEIWILQAIEGHNNTTATTNVLGVDNAGAFQVLKRQAQASVTEHTYWTGEIILAAGDRPRVTFLSTIAGDDLYWQFWGYKMKVA